MDPAHQRRARGTSPRSPFDWCLGALIYLLLPTVGPIYSEPDQFADLPHTYDDLAPEKACWTDRTAVLADPWAAGTLQTIAAFASLHVGIMMTICLVARAGPAAALGPASRRGSSWRLTCLSTVYLGWHFVVDVLGGIALGALAVWLAGSPPATGSAAGRGSRPRSPEPEPAASPAHP